jgi:hypothetical protein
MSTLVLRLRLANVGFVGHALDCAPKRAFRPVVRRASYVGLRIVARCGRC